MFSELITLTFRRSLEIQLFYPPDKEGGIGVTSAADRDIFA